MKKTQIIYESHHGNAKKAATMLGTFIGNTKVYAVDEATVAYLSNVKEQLAETPMAVVGISLYLIRITPQKYEILNSDFKKDGYDVKQVLAVT